jgi:hypothetical protein
MIVFFSVDCFKRSRTTKECHVLLSCWGPVYKYRSVGVGSNPTSDTSVTCLVCHVTNNFTSSGCSESLMRFAYTITLYHHHYLAGSRLSSAAARLRLLSSITVISRLTLQMQYLLISLQPLLISKPFVIPVSEETRLLSQTLHTQRFTVITLPWKRLLQTRYNIIWNWETESTGNMDK